MPANTMAMLKRHMERKRVIDEQIKVIEQTRLQRLERDPADKRNAMVLMLTRIVGLGMETAEQLVHEMLSRGFRDRKAVARYAGLTGSPDESGSKRGEKGLSRSGNKRVRTIMVQLSWRMLLFQPESNLVLWYKNRTENAKGSRNPLVVALARKLIIALWRYVHTGVVPEGFIICQAPQAVGMGKQETKNTEFWHSGALSDELPRTIRGSGCSRSGHGFHAG